MKPGREAETHRVLHAFAAAELRWISRCFAGLRRRFCGDTPGLVLRTMGGKIRTYEHWLARLATRWAAIEAVRQGLRHRGDCDEGTGCLRVRPTLRESPGRSPTACACMVVSSRLRSSRRRWRSPNQSTRSLSADRRTCSAWPERQPAKMPSHRARARGRRPSAYAGGLNCWTEAGMPSGSRPLTLRSTWVVICRVRLPQERRKPTGWDSQEFVSSRGSPSGASPVHGLTASSIGLSPRLSGCGWYGAGDTGRGDMESAGVLILWARPAAGRVREALSP